MVGALAAVLPDRPAPGTRWGDYPQRDEDRLRGLRHALLGRVRGLVAGPGRVATILGRAERLAAEERPLPALAAALRARVASAEGGHGTQAEALALACVAARRELGLTPYPSQLRAAAIMLDEGLAELATGEGKTLALALAAAARALTGVPVHVVTVNDYLVERDAAALEPFFRALGLTVDRVLAVDAPERRRRAWRADVVYCTAHELMFDYLRDRLAGADRANLGALAASLRTGAAGAGGTPLLRGLCSALLDEADGLLVDEATLPCILAQPDTDAGEGGWDTALRLARHLWQGRDYTLHAAQRRAALTDAGRERVARACAGLDGPWRIARRRDTLVAQALSALHLYRRDREYLVRDGRIEIVDANTGRVAPGRAWSAGLHQLIEHKERTAGTLPHRTMVQITSAQFFARYWRLGGLSATLAEAAGELASSYGVAVVKVPPRTPSRRVDLGLSVLTDASALRTELIARTRRLAASGRPVLIGTRDVAESEALAAEMVRAGLAPAVLNARHDRDEAATIAQAGTASRITIATNMAGRGTDIVLSPAVCAAGGLALVATHLHASRRLDRQLHGRVARRGEPGTVETLVSLDAPLAGAAGTPRLPPLVGHLPSCIACGVASMWIQVVQTLESTRARHARRRLRAQAEARARQHVIGRVID